MSFAPFFVVAALATQAAAEPSSGSVELRVSLEADEQYAICVRLLRELRELEGKSCLERIVVEHEDTTASLRASSVLSALPARAPVAGEVLPRDPIPFKPGHLGLMATLGAFGAWNGAALALWLSTSPTFVPVFVSAVGGAGAVVLGGAYGISTWLVADKLDLSAGDAKLLATGTTWGSALGLTLAPWIFSLAGVPWYGGLLPPFDPKLGVALPFAAFPTVVGGYLGMGGAAVMAAFLELEPAQVSNIGTGGLTGALLAIALTPVLALFGAVDPLWTSLLYLGVTSVGLAAGLGVAQLLRLDVWELLVVDAATVASFFAVGGAAFLLRAGTAPSKELDVVAGGATALGTAVGHVGTIAAVAFFRVRRGESASRAGFLPIDTMFAPPSAVLDRDRRLVPLVPLVALRF